MNENFIENLRKISEKGHDYLLDYFIKEKLAEEDLINMIRKAPPVRPPTPSLIPRVP